MTGWRHARSSQDPSPECRDCWDDHVDPCVYPQPDPTSPCGWVDSVDGKACGAPGDAQCHQPPCWPPYVPTLCSTCAHDITEAP